MKMHNSGTVFHEAHDGTSATSKRILIDLDGDLLALLRRAAQAHNQSAERLAAKLLARGLKQEAQRTHIEATLETLTPRQREVTLLASRGLTNRQIASVLVISPETVKSHIRHSLEKLGLSSKFELRLMLLKSGWIQQSPALDSKPT